MNSPFTLKAFVLLLFSLAHEPLSGDETKPFQGRLHTTKPFQGRLHTIPGLIEAEHWDEGAADVAYSDVDEVNKGEPYREKTQVDIEKRSDASNGHGIGWTKSGEWLIYTVEVKESGTYDIQMPVASNKQGGTFRIEINGTDLTGEITVPDTGGWQTLKMITHKSVKLTAGTHKMKVVMIKSGESGSIGDIDYFRFIRKS
ncbi:MAG: carbohydrate-binding protein [Verrucomicrobiales bacterium]|nr:carbohydrate-binding protein [Verrucomicrobiales bacterium]